MNPYEIALLQLQTQDSPADYKGTMQPAHWRKPSKMGQALANAFQQYDPSNAQAQRQIGSSSVGALLPNNPYRAEAERQVVNNVAQAMSDPMIARTLKGTSSPILMNPSRQELEGFLNRTRYNEVRGIKDPANGDRYFGDANLFDHKGMAEELGISWDDIISADSSHRVKGGKWLLDKVDN